MTFPGGLQWVVWRMGKPAVLDRFGILQKKVNLIGQIGVPSRPEGLT